MLQISSSRSPPLHVVTTWGGSASRDSEGGGREGGREGAEGSGLMGEQKGNTCTCMYWERRRKVATSVPPADISTYTYM